MGAAIDIIATVRLAEEIIDYIVRLVRATRESADLECGASPRAATLLARAACAAAALDGRDYVIPDDVQRLAAGVRSEEHTSELQSLMRISYAVFCLKKKKTHYTLTQSPRR